MILSQPVKRFASRGRAYIAALLVGPVVLSGCIFEGNLQEQYQVFFEEDGTVRYMVNVSGQIEESIRTAPPAEQQEILTEISEVIEAVVQRSLGEALLASTQDFSDLMQARVHIDARFQRNAMVNLEETDFDDIALRSTGPDAWALRFKSGNPSASDTTVCITIASAWTITEQPVDFPDAIVGETVCGDWVSSTPGQWHNYLELTYGSPN